MTFGWALIAFLGLLVAFTVASRIAMVMRSRAMVGKPAPELSGAPGRAIRKGKRALFYFYSAHCPPCRAMTPVVDELANKHADVFKIDISRDFDTARKFGVMATPSVVLVDKGTIQKFLIGAQSEAKLVQLMEDVGG
jgi:thioredoxin 1